MLLQSHYFSITASKLQSAIKKHRPENSALSGLSCALSAL
jgi:hypothetical protein